MSSEGHLQKCRLVDKIHSEKVSKLYWKSFICAGFRCCHFNQFIIECWNLSQCFNQQTTAVYARCMAVDGIRAVTYNRSQITAGHRAPTFQSVSQPVFSKIISVFLTREEVFFSQTMVPIYWSNCHNPDQRSQIFTTTKILNHMHYQYWNNTMLNQLACTHSQWNLDELATDTELNSTSYLLDLFV
jgi:hypothetical protein